MTPTRQISQPLATDTEDVQSYRASHHINRSQGDAPPYNREVAAFLDRAYDVYKAAEKHDAEDKEAVEVLNNALQAASHHAPLYFRLHIPPWPPRLLLRKIVRRLLYPFWIGQVQFNESSQTSLQGFSVLAKKHGQTLSDQQKRIAALEREVADLHTLLRQCVPGAPTTSLNAGEKSEAVSGAGLNAPTEIEPGASAAEAAWPVTLALLQAELSRPQTDGLFSPLYFDRLEETPVRSSGSGKPRIAFVSPLPPEQSGVADYSAEIVVPLSEHYDLDLYSDSGHAPPLPIALRTQPLSAWEQNIRLQRRSYQSMIYQLGNNASFHAQSYLLLLRYAGITVLHDYLLTHFFTYLCVQLPHLGVRFRDELIYEIGKTKADALVAAIKNGEMGMAEFSASGVPMNRRVFARSLGVVLHNEWSYKQAQKDRAQDNELITLIPPVIPPVKLGQTHDEIRALRQKRGIPADAFVIAPCGIVTETKRPFATLDAFKKLLIERPDAFLLFVGSVSLLPEIDFEEEIRKRGLTDRVKITGYVDVPTFNEYLLLSDVCVTLRFPSQGETSGALLRMLVHGKPSIVTAIGSFDDFPDDTVHKLPTPDKMADEVGEILEAFRLMANNTVYREKVAASGLAYVLREHSPERCARLYATFVDEVMKHPETRKKLIADWAGRDIARRTHAGAQTPNQMLAALEESLFQSVPNAAAPTPH